MLLLGDISFLMHKESFLVISMNVRFKQWVTKTTLPAKQRKFSKISHSHWTPCSHSSVTPRSSFHTQWTRLLNRQFGRNDHCRHSTLSEHNYWTDNNQEWSLPIISIEQWYGQVNEKALKQATFTCLWGCLLLVPYVAHTVWVCSTSSLCVHVLCECIYVWMCPHMYVFAFTVFCNLSLSVCGHVSMINHINIILFHSTSNFTPSNSSQKRPPAVKNTLFLYRCVNLFFLTENGINPSIKYQFHTN